MPTKYYNLWSLREDRWTNGYRTSNGFPINQNPNMPWSLTLEEVMKWVMRDWGGQDYIFPDSSIEDCNHFLRGNQLVVRELDYDYADQVRRQLYALKFL